ncbi:MAG: hypothetical protein ACC631_08555 [Halocynthiibacter sp.]
MADIANLELEEVVRLNPDRLTELYVRLGDHGAEEVICRAMEELAVLLADIQAVFAEVSPEILQKAAVGVAELAEHVGLTSLARVALDVDYCLHMGNVTAISATMARMIRIGKKSLTAVWDSRDMSM